MEKKKKRKRSVSNLTGADGSEEPEETRTLKRQYATMYKRLKQKNKELIGLDTHVKVLLDKQEAQHEALFTIHQSWTQVCADLQAITQQLGVQAGAPPHLQQALDHLSASSKNPFVQMFLADKKQAEAEPNALLLKPSLASLEADTAELMKRVVRCLGAKSEREMLSLAALREAAKDRVEAVVVEANTSLEAAVLELKAELGKLQVKHRRQAEKLSVLKEREMTFDLDVSNANAATENLRWELTKVERKYDSLEAAHKALGRPGLPLASIQPVNAVASTLVGNRGSDEAGGTDNETRIADLEAQVEEWKTISGTRLKDQDLLRQQIKALHESVSALKAAPAETNLAALSRRLTTSSADSVTLKSALHRTCEELSMERNKRVENEQTFRETEALHQKQFTERFRDAQNKMDEMSASQTRIEKERDELKGKVEEARLISSRFDNARRAKGKAELHATALQAELGALQKAKHVESEAKVRQIVLRSLLSKSRALDIREKLLAGQVQALPTHGQEVVAMQREETRLKEQLQQATAKMESLSADCSELALREELEESKSMAEELSTLLDDLAKSVEEEEEKNAKLSNQYKDLEKQNAKLNSANKRAIQLQGALRQEKELLVAKCQVEVDKCRMQRVVLKEEQDRGKVVEHQKAKLQQQSALVQAELRTLAEQHREKTQQAERIKEEILRVRKLHAEAKARLDEKIMEAEDKEKKLRLLKEANATLKRKCDRAKSMSSTIAVESGLEAELALMKHRIRCSVCSDRDKSVIITKCFHMFCAECIDSNLKVRHRKCPGCGVSFGECDVKPIYLT